MQEPIAVETDRKQLCPEAPEGTSPDHSWIFYFSPLEHLCFQLTGCFCCLFF
jgi:hypothetical protein